jgi:hypothetical protein
MILIIDYDIFTVSIWSGTGLWVIEGHFNSATKACLICN